jgi:hypothetical protein
MEILLVRAESFYKDRQAGRQTDRQKLIIGFRNFAKAPKNSTTLRSICKLNPIVTERLSNLILTKLKFFDMLLRIQGAGMASQYSELLRAGGSGNRIPVRERFSAPSQTGSEVHLALLYNGYLVFPEGKCCRGMALTTHPPPSAEVHGKE